MDDFTKPGKVDPQLANAYEEVLGNPVAQQDLNEETNTDSGFIENKPPEIKVQPETIKPLENLVNNPSINGIADLKPQQTSNLDMSLNNPLIQKEKSHKLKNLIIISSGIIFLIFYGFLWSMYFNLL